MTGLPNRALFNDRLENGLAQAKRHGRALAVMFIDLDKFKNINDTYGHDAGDVVLQTAARRLTANTRGADTVSRYGGDEFLYLVTEIQREEDIAMIADKLMRTLEEPCDIRVKNNLKISVSVKASIGISIFSKNGMTAEILIKSADGAMYQAKETQSGYFFAH